MSRDPKLDLFDKVLKQELGLEYTRQGDVKLNFFPDSGNSGVSVPLVLAGNTREATLALPRKTSSRTFSGTPLRMKFFAT